MIVLTAVAAVDGVLVATGVVASNKWTVIGMLVIIWVLALTVSSAQSRADWYRRQVQETVRQASDLHDALQERDKDA